MLAFADKCKILYGLLCDYCKKLLPDNITQTHKKASTKTKKNNDNKSKKFAKSIGLRCNVTSTKLCL